MFRKTAASAFKHSVSNGYNPIADMLKCVKVGYGSNMVEFARETLGLQQSANQQPQESEKAPSLPSDWKEKIQKTSSSPTR